MITFMFRFILATVIIFAVASTGLQFDDRKIDNPIIQFMVTGWNALANNLNRYVIENHDELFDYAKTRVNDGAGQLNDLLIAIEEKIETDNDRAKNQTDILATQLTAR